MKKLISNNVVVNNNNKNQLNLSVNNSDYIENPIIVDKVNNNINFIIEDDYTICTTDIHESCSKLSEEFQCIICLNILIDPVTCKCCNSSFCRICINKWINQINASNNNSLQK